MKYALLGTLFLAAAPLMAQESKPLSADAQIKLLKAERQVQQVRIQMADLQRQFDQATFTVKQLQAQMEADCAAAAAESKVDLTKYACDVDKLAFVPKPAESPKPPAEKK